MKHLPRILVRHLNNCNFATGDIISFDSFDSHHIINVLRKSSGDSVIIFNNLEEWNTQISIVNKYSVAARTTHFIRSTSPKQSKLHLFLSPFRKCDCAIEKAVEFGVTDIHPIRTTYANTPLFNVNKIMKITKQALEQSLRIGDVTVHPITEMEVLLNKITFKVFACIEDTINDLKHILNYLSESFSWNLGIIVGPEGGFSSYEKELLLNHQNTIPVSLGQNILRAETAIIFASGIMSFMSLNNIKETNHVETIL